MLSPHLQEGNFPVGREAKTLGTHVFQLSDIRVWTSQILPANICIYSETVNGGSCCRVFTCAQDVPACEWDWNLWSCLAQKTAALRFIEHEFNSITLGKARSVLPYWHLFKLAAIQWGEKKMKEKEKKAPPWIETLPGGWELETLKMSTCDPILKSGQKEIKKLAGRHFVIILWMRLDSIFHLKQQVLKQRCSALVFTAARTFDTHLDFLQTYQSLKGKASHRQVGLAPRSSGSRYI